MSRGSFLAWFLVSRTIGLFYATDSDGNDFVNAQSNTGKKLQLAGSQQSNVNPHLLPVIFLVTSDTCVTMRRTRSFVPSPLAFTYLVKTRRKRPESDTNLGRDNPQCFDLDFLRLLLHQMVTVLLTFRTSKHQEPTSLH